MDVSLTRSGFELFCAGLLGFGASKREICINAIKSLLLVCSDGFPRSEEGDQMNTSLLNGP